MNKINFLRFSSLNLAVLVLFGYFIEFYSVKFRHIGIHPEHRKYLGVSITDTDGKTLYFRWKVLFLGVKDAVFLFTLILKPIRVYLANLGVPSLIYLDDILASGDNEEKAIANREILLDTLAKAGFVVSLDKTKGPSHRILFLGLEICSSSLKFFIPESKLLIILNEAQVLLSSRRVKVRSVARFVGLIQSCSRALGGVVRIKSRRLYDWMTEKLLHGPYDFYHAMSETGKEELHFWLTHLRELNGFFFNPKLSFVETEFSVASDSSAVGMFGYQISSPYEVLLRKMFTEEEFKSSSTVRELLALQNIYCSNVSDKFKGARVRHYTDNQAVVNIIETGSNKMHLLDIALRIFHACREKQITLSVEWKSRQDVLIQHADFGSKSFDSSAVSLNFSSFMLIMNFFEMELQVDCMANSWNRKCLTFFSKIYEEGCAGVNFFSQILYQRVSYYCFPPPSMILASIHHFAKYKVFGLLVVPVWKASSFWMRLVPDGKHLPIWARKFLMFKPNGFISDSAIISRTFKNPPTFDMLVILFDFSEVQDNDLFVSLNRRENCIADHCVDH